MCADIIYPVKELPASRLLLHGAKVFDERGIVEGLFKLFEPHENVGLVK